jgi:hypothetical protein
MNPVVFALMVSMFYLATAGRIQAQSVSVPLTSDRLVFSQRNFKIPELKPHGHNGELVDFLGRPSFRLVRGLFYARDVNFQNGTIDVDMAADDDSHFLGIAFRVESDDDYELIFFRPKASGTTQAVQYTPAFQGANVWQLYTGPGYTAAAEIPRNQWIHVRIVVAGLVAKLFLNHADQPTLVVPDLKLGYRKGSIGFWGHMGGGYFSNLSYAAENIVYTPEVKRDFLIGTLTDWKLSDVFDVSEKDPSLYPDVRSLKWEVVAAETPGMVVINRYRRSPNIDSPEREDRIRGLVPGAKVVFARTIIHSGRDEIRKMSLGYSDEVVVSSMETQSTRATTQWDFASLVFWVCST